MSTKTTFNEIETLKRIKADLEEAIGYEYLNDRAYLKHYRILLKRCRIVTRAIRRLERLQRCQ